MTPAQRGARMLLRELPYFDRVPTLASLKAEPVKFLIEHAFPEGVLALLAGGPGQYKSWITLDMACAIASGGRFAGLKTAGPREVLYVDRENPRNIIANRRGRMGLERKGQGGSERIDVRPLRGDAELRRGILLH